MAHIEFLGPPGAGKSTVCSKLIELDRFYGGTKEDAIRRLFLQKAGLKYRLPYRITPSFLRGVLEDEFLEFRFRYTALDDFLVEHPNFIQSLSVAMDSVTHEPERLFTLCRRSAERYQLGVSTVSVEETLCLDEGFAQRAFSILWREPDEVFSLEKYFDSVPTPELLVYIDAPSDVCLGRQDERERLPVAKEWESGDMKEVQDKTREHCFEVRDYLARKTSVVNIDNTGPMVSAVEEISSAFSELSE